MMDNYSKWPECLVGVGAGALSKTTCSAYIYCLQTYLVLELGAFFEKLYDLSLNYNKFSM